MVAIQTQDLIDAALDWAVASCEGYEVSGPWLVPQEGYLHDEKPLASFRPSTDWAQGGPIIERENISVGHQGHLGVPLDSLWYATDRVDACGFGQTPLLAALRCFVASKLGPTVEVPEELVP